MKKRPLRISTIILLVAVVALNFGVLRSFVQSRSSTVFLLGMGARPMANVLAGSLLIGHMRPGYRQFLVGFVTFGATALAAYLAIAMSFPHEIETLCTDRVNS
jgi:hypothetical protein